MERGLEFVVSARARGEYEILAGSSAKAIAGIKFDKITVWDGGQPGGGAAGFLKSLGQAVPPLMDVMRSVGGVDLPPYFGKLVVDDPNTPNAPPAQESTGVEGLPSAKAAGGDKPAR